MEGAYTYQGVSNSRPWYGHVSSSEKLYYHAGLRGWLIGSNISSDLAYQRRFTSALSPVGLTGWQAVTPPSTWVELPDSFVSCAPSPPSPADPPDPPALPAPSPPPPIVRCFQIACSSYSECHSNALAKVQANFGEEGELMGAMWADIVAYGKAGYAVVSFIFTPNFYRVLVPYFVSFSSLRDLVTELVSLDVDGETDIFSILVASFQLRFLTKMLRKLMRLLTYILTCGLKAKPRSKASSSRYSENYSSRNSKEMI